MSNPRRISFTPLMQEQELMRLTQSLTASYFYHLHAGVLLVVSAVVVSIWRCEAGYNSIVGDKEKLITKTAP